MPQPPKKVHIAKRSQQKNPHAVALGKLGGKEGGHARAEALNPAQRSEIAAKGGHARAAHLRAGHRRVVSKIGIEAKAAKKKRGF